MRTAVVSLLMVCILATGCARVHQGGLALLMPLPRAATTLAAVQGESCASALEGMTHLMPILLPLASLVAPPHLERAIRDALDQASGANALVDVRVAIEDGCYRVEGLAATL